MGVTLGTIVVAALAELPVERWMTRRSLAALALFVVTVAASFHWPRLQSLAAVAWTAVVLFVVGGVVKAFGVAVALPKADWRSEGLVVLSLVNCRGATGLVFVGVASSTGLIGSTVSSGALLWVAVATLSAPSLTRLAHRRARARLASSSPS